MPIAAVNIANAEVIMHGLITSGGAGSINTQFVFHYKRGSTAPALTKAALDTIFQSGVAVSICAALNARWTQTINTIRWLDDPLDVAVPFTHAVVGSIAGDSLSSHLAGYILMRTGLRGRSYRGSKHFGPFSESDVTTPNDDIFNAGCLARLVTIQGNVGATLTDTNFNAWDPVVYSRKLSLPTLQPIASIVSNVVQTVLVNKRVGNMRRRQAKSLY